MIHYHEPSPYLLNCLLWELDIFFPKTPGVLIALGGSDVTTFCSFVGVCSLTCIHLYKLFFMLPKTSNFVFFVSSMCIGNIRKLSECTTSFFFLTPLIYMCVCFEILLCVNFRKNLPIRF